MSEKILPEILIETKLRVYDKCSLALRNPLKEKESALLKSVEIDKLSEEQSREVLKQINELHKKYNR